MIYLYNIIYLYYLNSQNHVAEFYKFTQFRHKKSTAAACRLLSMLGMRIRLDPDLFGRIWSGCVGPDSDPGINK
jgi:hypothetical protein